MAAVGLSRDVVREHLRALEVTYASFTVNQTTLAVSAKTYRRARDRFTEGLADVYVRVSNDEDGVLLVDGERGRVVPSVSPPMDAPLEPGVCHRLADDTGVECEVTDLERVTILGACHEDDPECETVYRLVAVFDARRIGGTPGDGATWCATLPDSALPHY